MTVCFKLIATYIWMYSKDLHFYSPVIYVFDVTICTFFIVYPLASYCSYSSFYCFCLLTYTSFISRRRQWHPTPVLLPRKSHGWRSLVGCSPWGRYKSDVTERLHFHFSLSHNGEGNGNPLQCSCLENPRVRRAWWAAIYGVAQSRTRLKWLSSCSFISD